jgi:hypothetical protein
MKLAKVLAFVVSLAAASTVSAAQWQTNRYEKDGFSADFPGDIAVDTSADASAPVARTTNYIWDGGSGAYMVVVTRFRDGFTFDFDAGVNRGMSVYDCKSIESDVTRGGQGDKTREIRASSCHGGTLRYGGKFLMKGQWFYQAFYLAGPGSNTADAERFLTSFRLLDTPPS